MDAPPLFRRLLEDRVAEALADTPVVLVAGPRQAGKTTLVRQMVADERRFQPRFELWKKRTI
jgi:predicted AAA+ superfamily ATPase